MHIQLTGHHMNITDALRNHIENKFAKLEKHFDHLIKTHVLLSVEKRQHKAEATIHVSKGGGNIFANATHDDMYTAIDALADKLDRQVLRHKEKLSNNYRKGKPVPVDEMDHDV